MEVVRSKIFQAKVMHKRLQPKENTFSYQIYNLGIILSELHTTVAKVLKINRFGLMSFYEQDHNTLNNSTKEWIDTLLIQQGLDPLEHEVMLVSMPRILGYVFNPVSFWLCIHSNNQLSMVVCEVCNTFGEKHNYICLPPQGHSYIASDMWVHAEKVFHVSPFLERSGQYQFKFHLENQNLQICINAYNQEKKKILVTSLIGTLKPMTKSALRGVFWRYPLVTIKAILLIYMQAIKLKLKKIRYRTKPTQHQPNISHTH